jgi:hypothetical protein
MATAGKQNGKFALSFVHFFRYKKYLQGLGSQNPKSYSVGLFLFLLSLNKKFISLLTATSLES